MAKNNSRKKGFDDGFWSKQEIKSIFLEEQREYIWNKNYWRDVIVPLLRLETNSVILDVGCGLGFLGRCLAEFIPEGKIVGVDLDSSLVEAARKRAEEQGLSEIVDFRVGNALELPVESETVDLSICQTLLMHLDNPMKAIKEMCRVTKTGGRIVAIEPDFASYSYFDTAYETIDFSLDQRVKLWHWGRLLTIGKKKLGRGDNEIGLKIPYLFYNNGLDVLDVRCSDRVFWLIPPYEGRELELKHMLLPPEVTAEKLDLKSEFLAGGGTDEEWIEYIELLKRIQKVREQQIKEKSFVSSISQAATITIAEKI